MPDVMRGSHHPLHPYDADGRLDVAALRRVVEFCVGCGAHGIVSR